MQQSFWSVNLQRVSSVKINKSPLSTSPTNVSNNESKNTTQKPPKKVKLPASFCGIHIYESTDIGDIKIENTSVNDPITFTGELTIIENSQNDVATKPEGPTKDGLERPNSVSKKVVCTIIEVNGNQNENTNVEEPNNQPNV